MYTLNKIEVVTEFKHLQIREITDSGGYVFSKPPGDIKLLSIIRAVDEKIKTVKCRKESKKGCNGKSIKCITHNLWDDLESHINKFFEDNTLKDILFKEVRNNPEELKQ